ncbi:MAG: hypothetical protein IJ071_10570 [Ruminococcus sp.]|nr:hypothetical protein [Ruminococcus sp.]
MKARTDCVTCRKRIHQEEQEAFLKHEYKLFSDMAYSMACFAVCGTLGAQIRRGRSKEYVKKLYDDICFFFSTPYIFGKEITMTDVMHQLTAEYDIDFDKLTVNLETEREFVRSAKEGVKNG